MINKKPTIQMVADKAGVSRGTVDRVLNNRSHVSPDVYERVMAAIQETGYLTPAAPTRKPCLVRAFRRSSLVCFCPTGPAISAGRSCAALKLPRPSSLISM
ncbi:helix-turn-helix domain-containing protein [Blautia sp. RD014234]|nr:helix-turn-helix domain-containing protein [Blautia parvula]